MGLVPLPLLYSDVELWVVPCGVLILPPAAAATTAHKAHHQYHQEDGPSPTCRCCYDDRHGEGGRGTSGATGGATGGATSGARSGVGVGVGGG